MDVDEASRAVQDWQVGNRGMCRVNSGTGSFRFITWQMLGHKSERAELRKQLQTPHDQQARTYLCVYCGHFTLQIYKHLQAFNAGKKGCNMRFVQDHGQRSHLSSLAAASAASAGTKPRGHLEAVHASVSNHLTQIRQVVDDGFRKQAQAQAAHHQAVLDQTALSQSANTRITMEVRNVRQKVDVLVPDQEKVTCMVCTEDVPATDAVRCEADMQKHSVCQTCFVDQNDFDLSQRACKCQVYNCGGELCPPVQMNAATFDFFRKVHSLIAELEVTKTMQQEKERSGKMSPTERLVEVLRETLVPKCPGTPFAHPRPSLD